MFQHGSVVAATIRPPADFTSFIQFYSIDLTPMADGRLYVGVTATICEREGELDSMELASDRVDSIDKALNIIREAIAPRD